MAQDRHASTPAKPTEEEIQSWLIRHIAENSETECTDLDVTKPFSSFGLSSVESIAISGDLEIWLNRRLPPTLTWDYPTIELLAAYLAKEQ